MLAHPGLSHVHAWVEKGDITSKVSILGLSVTVNIISNITVTYFTRGYFIWDYSLLLLRTGDYPNGSIPLLNGVLESHVKTKLFNAKEPQSGCIYDQQDDAHVRKALRKQCRPLRHDGLQVHHGFGWLLCRVNGTLGGG